MYIVLTQDYPQSTRKEEPASLEVEHTKVEVRLGFMQLKLHVYFRYV